jgi:hypothetical protein
MDAYVPRHTGLVRSHMAHYIPFLALTQRHQPFGSPETEHSASFNAGRSASRCLPRPRSLSAATAENKLTFEAFVAW